MKLFGKPNYVVACGLFLVLDESTDGLAARSNRTPRTTPSELESRNAVIHLIEFVG